MTHNPHYAKNSFSKSKIIISIQIILQGITPVALSISPSLAFSAANKDNVLFERQITPKQRAIIEADYIKRYHFITGHTLSENESLSSVAKRYYVSIATLREINEHRFPDDKDFYQVHAGQYLMVPRWESAQQAASELAKCHAINNISGRFLTSPSKAKPVTDGTKQNTVDQSSAGLPPVIWVTDQSTQSQPHTTAQSADGTQKPASQNTAEQSSAGQQPAAWITDQPPQPEQQDKDVAQWLAGAGQAVQNGNATDTAKNMALNGASNAVSNNAENWLNQYGHARIQMNVNDRMHLDGSSADLLLPLHDANGVMTFTQLGIHDKNSYTTANLGLGQRFFSPQQMWGYNGFIDQEVRNNHTRVGLGLEYWRNYIRLAGNGYVGLTGWKESKNLDNYEEKAASGFDLRGAGYLPSMPQLGAKLSYEQYFGDEVGLFGKDKRQRDPFAVTAGVNYTPIPLVTTGIDYKQGKSGAHDTQFSLQFNYLFGVPWQEQIASEHVNELRTLAGSKLEFVDRNNNMVMQYRKMEMISLSLPAALRGDTNTQQVILATVKSRNGLSRIQWNDAALIAAGGSIKAVDRVQYQITLPAKAGDFALSAIAYDEKGNASNSASTLLTVSDNFTSPTVAISSLEPNPLQAQADNLDVITYTLTTSEQTRLAAQNGTSFKVKWSNAGTGTLSEAETDLNSQGQAAVQIISSLSGKVNLTATLVDAVGTEIDSKQDQRAEFVNNYKAELIGTPASVEADGKTPITWQVTATDNGTPLVGYTVNWTRTAGVGDFDKASSVTDNNGVATVNMTSSTPGTTQVLATLLNTEGLAVTSANGSGEFTAPTPIVINVDLSSSHTNQWTDRDVTLNATVKDGSGTSLSGVDMKWDLSDCDDCTPLLNETTDDQGKINGITLSLQNGAPAGDRTLKLCTTDATPSCSAPVKISYVAMPEITGYQTLGGSVQTGDMFNEVRLKGGEFNIITTQLDSKLTYSWRSRTPSAAEVDSNGKVTLLDSDGTDIFLGASMVGLETREIKFTIQNGSWYSISETSNVYPAINTQMCKSPLVGADSLSEFEAITKTWGDLAKYSRIKVEFGHAWVDGTINNTNNGATIWILRSGSVLGDVGETRHPYDTVNPSNALCR